MKSVFVPSESFFHLVLIVPLGIAFVFNFCFKLELYTHVYCAEGA